MGADGLREELTAHVSVTFMSLIGLAVYSGSYSVTMAMGVSAQASPVLEMWVVFSHLASSLACLALQVLTAGVLSCDGAVPHVGTSQVSAAFAKATPIGSSDAPLRCCGPLHKQVSVFLGIACAATCASAGGCSSLWLTPWLLFRSADAPS